MALACGLAAAQGKKTVTDENPLGLSDDQYWGKRPKVSRAVTRPLREEGFNGVLIGAPTFASLDRATLPVVTWRGGTYRQVAELSYVRRALMTIVDVERNVLHVDFAADQEREFGNDPIPEQEGYSGSTKVVDIKPMGELSKPGIYVATVIMRDKVSNRARIEVGTAPGSYKDEEVQAFLREQRAKLQAPQPKPMPAKEGIPSYARDDAALPVPEEVGLVLKADQRVVLLEEGATSVLRGAFRLPCGIHEVVKPEEKKEAEDGEETPPTWLETIEPKPTAVLKINLLITGGDRADPLPVILRVPVYEPVPAGEGDADPVVTGQFAVDLFKVMPELKNQAQTYFVYGFSGEAMAGPAVTALVTEDMLPKRD